MTKKKKKPQKGGAHRTGVGLPEKVLPPPRPVSSEGQGHFLPSRGLLSTQAQWLEFSSPQGRPEGSAEALPAACVAILGERFQPVLHH